MSKNNINASELAAKAEVGASFVYDVVSGKSKNPTIGKLSAIADILGVSVSYLQHGEDLSNIGTIDNALVPIPTISANVSPDGEIVIDDHTGQPYYFHTNWIESSLKANPANIRVFAIEGDYMSPTLEEGDMVLIDISRKQVTPPGIFATYDGMGIVVKRIEYIESAEPILRVISDNDKYGVIEKKLSDTKIIGRVIWFSRPLI